MKFKENLRYLRRMNNMSQDDLANKLGYKSFTTVQKWEDGTSFPKVSNLNKLAEMFDIELDHLLNIDLKGEEKTAVPIVGTVKAGYDLFADETLLGYEYCNNSEYKSGEYFYLKVTGDSMLGRRIGPNDIVYVRRQTYLEPGQIGVFIVPDNEVTIKEYSVGDGEIILKAANAKYEDRHYRENEVIILGRVMHSKVMF